MRLPRVICHRVSRALFCSPMLGGSSHMYYPNDKPPRSCSFTFAAADGVDGHTETQVDPVVELENVQMVRPRSEIRALLNPSSQ
eukprot:13310481-Heterocapsa_arctica.AAC.1